MHSLHLPVLKPIPVSIIGSRRFPMEDVEGDTKPVGRPIS